MNPASRVLVIAGSDTSGGAGLQRDLGVVERLGCRHASVVTALTAQTDNAVAEVFIPPPEIIAAQLAAAFSSGPIAAIKIGMLGNAPTLEAVADGLGVQTGAPLVLDPVLASSSGQILLDEPGRRALKIRLLPLCTLLTPNLEEAALLTDQPLAVSAPAIQDQANRLLAMGAKAVLIKGGHGTGEEATDWLVQANAKPLPLPAQRLQAHMRGTGCALSSAIAARLAHGDTLEAACRRAKTIVHAMIAAHSTNPPSHS